MTDELVNDIVRQVMAALRQRGVAAGQAPSAAPRPALTGGNGKPAPAAVPQKVFITAEMLLRRLATDGQNGRTLELAANEFLTPAAADVLDERHLSAKRLEPLLPAPPPADAAQSGDAASACQRARAGGAAAIGLVIDRPNETARSVLAALRHDGLAIVDYSQTDCWIVNTRVLCEAVAGGSVRAGVALVPHAADAMVLANKVRGIRAVQGSRVESVAAAMRHFAANLLVVEHVVSTYHELRTMVRAFAGDRPSQPAATVLMDALGELEGA